MRLDAVLLTLLLSEASAAPRKKRDIGAVEHEHAAHHAVSFFDSFFSFFGGGSDTSPQVYFEPNCKRVFDALLLRIQLRHLNNPTLCLPGLIQIFTTWKNFT